MKVQGWGFAGLSFKRAALSQDAFMWMTAGGGFASSFLFQSLGRVVESNRWGLRSEGLGARGWGFGLRAQSSKGE